MEEINPIGVLLSSFAVSAIAGLAALLRSEEKLTWIKVLSSVLNSGMLGLGISLLWYLKFQTNIYMLIGICVLAGLGGMTTIEFVLAAFRKGGFSVVLGKNGSVEIPDNTKEKDDEQDGKA